ncbi:sugar-binding protein [Chryseobacterium sp. MYb7]|uniref:DUF6443 domain-containing protein n=1 Tax=Chryseobacterium sp. MYb7 TaxID=1827290 RepID=UPI000D46B026|nr:DUF6443 domain-containing protein [Chryseobacterium sp. MYb7]PRA95686.1 sugar-binding protein [Chryseobacterium sp. MYb7]
MKRILNIFSLLWIAGHSYAQTLNATTSENYVYTKNCLDADCIKKTEAIQYFDGLGRTKQTIGIKATPSGKDVVNHVEYDAFGRVAKEYLPIPQNTTQNGAFYSTPLANAPVVFGQEKIYSEKQFENSPLSRVDKITPLGNDWAQHPVQMGYSANIAGEVKKYTVINSWVDEATYSKLVESGTYGANQLMKTTAIDSDNNTSVEFKNAAGQTILVRKNDGIKDVDTYYVYNDLGMQVFIITPLASTTMVDGNALDNLCYQYRYDSLGRLVEKKLPGKDWEYMVYDKADRLILSRDTNMKQNNQWLITKYDELGRPVYTGFLTGGDRATRQNDLKNLIITEKRDATGFFRSATNVYYTENYFNGETPVILSINYYDTYPQGTPSKPASIFGQDIIGDNLSASQNTKNLPTASYVKNIDDDNWTYNWIWYDSKLRAVGSHSINHLGGYTKTETKLDFAGVAMQSKAYHKRVQTDTERIISQIFEYDDHNRLLVQKHQVDNNPVEILSQNEYNEQSQLKRKKIGGTLPSSPLQAIDYSYNALGALIKINDPVNLNGKLFGYGIKYTNPEYSNVGQGKYNGTITEIDWQNASENVQKRYTYTYDKLNRLKDAIYSEPGSTTPFNNYYNEYLTYDLNGNIKTLKRNAFPIFGTTATQVDDLVYDYTGNRLTKVTENSLNDSGYEGGNNTITYDLNGNMKEMLDKGIQSISYNFLNLSDTFTIVQNAFGNPINNTLKYLYSADGTKFRKIYTSQTTGRGASTTTQTTDYLDGFQYTFEDGSACLTCRTSNAYEQQAYKGIADPERVITPLWNLDFVGTSEGYYSFTQNRYIYQYKDHLGNTRVSFAKNSAGVPEILDTNNYYPFGLNHIGNTFSPFGSFYSYKYNGKELQESGMYDFGARMYMPDLGRWNATDPLAEAFSQFSSYHYGANNPVMFTDPDGMRNVPYDGGVISNVPDGSYWFAGMNGNFTYTPQFKQGSKTGGGSGGSSVNLVNRIASLGGNWTNTGSGFQDSSFISLGYDGSYQSLNSKNAEGGIGDAYVNIPTVELSGNFAIEFALQLRNHINDYMAGWNAQSMLEWKKLSCPRCFDGPITFIGNAGDPAGVFDIGGQVISNWKPENRYLAMGVGIIGGIALRKPGLAVKEADGAFYSIAYEMKLAKSSYPGVTRYMHFKEANIALESAMKSNPLLNELGIAIPKSVSGSIIGKSPKNWVWHHDIDKGVMQLVPKSQHPNVPGGIFWETMHPGRKGGFSIWGKK